MITDKHRGEFTKLEVDGMPADTALENLIAPTQNTSSSFKRECRRARQTYWTIARPAKSAFQLQANRMRKKPIDRVLRAFVRSVRRLKKIDARIPDSSDEMTRELRSRLMAPLVALALAAKNETAQRSRSIALYTAYKLIKAAEKTPDKFSVDEVNAAKKFLLESLIPASPQQSTTTPNGPTTV